MDRGTMALQLSMSLVLGILLWLGGAVLPAASWAAVAPSQQTAVEVAIHLGTAAGELKFVPAQLDFQAGQRYKLILDNPSPQKHYFTAKDFADVIWTQKVDAGNVEIKGAIHELELRPGSKAEWVFVPLKPGTYELYCSIPGHREAGMTGKLIIGS